MHAFVFQQGEWLGQGQISFSDSPAVIRYYTKWVVRAAADGVSYCEQRVEREGVEESLFNIFRFKAIDATHFTVDVEGDLLGSISGNGLIEPTRIFWQFTQQQPLEGAELFSGFEEYLLEEENEYTLHAEYCADNHTSLVKGRLWKKN